MSADEIRQTLRNYRSCSLNLRKQAASDPRYADRAQEADAVDAEISKLEKDLAAAEAAEKKAADKAAK